MIEITKKVEDYMNLLNNKKYVNDIIKVSNLKFINFEEKSYDGESRG